MKNTWTSYRKRRAGVKTSIFGLEQFLRTGRNVYRIQTFRCLSRAITNAYEKDGSCRTLPREPSFSFFHFFALPFSARCLSS